MSETIAIPALDGSGKMNAYLATPSGQPKAGIVVIQEIFGVNAGVRAETDGWAAKGYAAIAPDLFWRLKPGVELDADVPEQFQQGLAYMQKFDTNKSIDDIKACIAALRARGCKKVGAIGHCLGGRLAFLAATRTDSDATAAYYGVGLDGLVGEKGNIRKPLLMHIAKKDGFVPPEAQAKVHAALDGNSLVTIHDYDADHAFARHSGKARVPALAEQADARTASFFTKNLS